MGGVLEIQWQGQAVETGGAEPTLLNLRIETTRISSRVIINEGDDISANLGQHLVASGFQATAPLDVVTYTREMDGKLADDVGRSAVVDHQHPAASVAEQSG